MASRCSVRHSRASEWLVSVEEALEMIHTQGSDVEEAINNSSNENFDPYSEETDVDTDTEVGADSGKEADVALPAHKPQQHESDTYMGEEVDYFSWNPMSEHPIRGFLAILVLIHSRKDYCQWYITGILCIVNSFCCCSSCKDTFLHLHILNSLFVIEYYISCVFSNSSCARMWCRTFLSC